MTADRWSEATLDLGDEIAQAIFDVLEEAMVPAGPHENGDDYGQWISDLAPDLLAERIMAALTSHPTAAATAGAVPVSAEATAAPGSGGSDLPSDPP